MSGMFVQVALLNGITMGGGAGISIPGTFRVATDKTVCSIKLYIYVHTNPLAHYSSICHWGIVICKLGHGICDLGIC